jgi:phasin family protein
MSQSKFKKSSARTSARSAYNTAESARGNAENVMKLGTDAVRDFFSTGAGEAQKAQEKVFAIGRENAENIARSADVATKGLNEAISDARKTIEAYVECGNITTEMTKTLSAELFQFANQAAARNMEVSKEIFGCRTLNDLFELQSRLFKSNVDNFFSESVKMSEMLFQYATEAAEPLSERVSQAANRFSRSLAA